MTYMYWNSASTRVQTSRLLDEHARNQKKLAELHKQELDGHLTKKQKAHIREKERLLEEHDKKLDAEIKRMEIKYDKQLKQVMDETKGSAAERHAEDKLKALAEKEKQHKNELAKLKKSHSKKSKAHKAERVKLLGSHGEKVEALRREHEETAKRLAEKHRIAITMMQEEAKAKHAKELQDLKNHHHAKHTKLEKEKDALHKKHLAALEKSSKEVIILCSFDFMIVFGSLTSKNIFKQERGSGRGG